VDKRNKQEKHLWIETAAAVLFWVLVWSVLVFWLDKKSEMTSGNILVASPLETVKALVGLIQTTEFWKAVGYSFAKIASGFFLAVAAGVLCAVAASVSGLVKALLSPMLRLIKAVPVASFIILALFLLPSSKNLSVLISFLMVLPVIYTNVLQGIEATNEELLEMAEVFRVSFGKRIRYIYLPAVLPYFVSACSVGLGFCFKSGIAAEIIGLPQNSIGERLYDAKLSLNTEELFAWTAVIVLVSVIFEKVVMLLVTGLAKALAGNVRGAEALEQDVTGRSDTEAETQNQTEGQTTAEEWGKRSEERKTASENRLGNLRRGLLEVEEARKEHAAPENHGLYEVTKRFEDKTVLAHFTLSVSPGETVALMGASGGGKSTVGKLFLGILETDAGKVKRPKRMGAVFQENRLCREFDAVTNIAMVTGDRKTAEKALEEVGLCGIKGKPIAALSGGMKRRVAIVRALLSDGEVLVLDEPFTGLDAASKQLVMQYVKEKLNGRSALLITHNEEEAAYLADRTVLVTQCMSEMR